MEERKERMIRDWFILRYHKLPDYDIEYYEDWVKRFAAGDALNFMDIKSRAAWTKVENAYH